MNYYKLHGTLQAIAFLLLFPIGVLIALFRERIGPSWRTYHVIFQLTATLTVVVAISSVVYANRQQPKKETSEEENPSALRRIHKILGPIVASLILVQLLWAFFGRKLMMDWNRWYQIHITLSGSILLGGITNVLIGLNM